MKLYRVLIVLDGLMQDELEFMLDNDALDLVDSDMILNSLAKNGFLRQSDLKSNFKASLLQKYSFKEKELIKVIHFSCIWKIFF